MNEEELILEKLHVLRTDLVLAYDSSKKFSLAKEIEELEKRLEEIRRKPLINQSINQVDTKFYIGNNNWLQNLGIIKWAGSIVGVALICVFIYFAFCNDPIKRPTSYIVEGTVKDQTNKPVSVTKIEVNGKTDFTQQDGSFSIKNVKVGKSGKIKFDIGHETFLKDSSEYDYIGEDKIQIIENLRVNIEEKNN